MNDLLKGSVMANLLITSGAIQKAKRSVDLFGLLGGDSVKEQLKTLQKVYNPLVKIVFPDVYVDFAEAKPIAEKAFKILADFKALAEEEIKSGTYGKALEPIQLVALGHTYVLKDLFRAGEMSDLYLSNNELLKVVRSPDDNDLMLAEQNHLTKLRKYLVDKSVDIWLQTIPEIKSSFRLLDNRRVNVMDYHDRFLSGEEIVEQVSKVDFRTLVWMFKRLFSLLEWVGHSGLVHGAVLPSHVLFFPDNANSNPRDVRKHSVHLVDWCYSATSGSRLKAFVPKDIAFYPPEVMKKEPVTFQTDLFMAVKTMIYLSGADPAKNAFPDDFPPAICAHLLSCLNPAPAKRVPSRSKFYAEFQRLMKAEFGPPSWHQFIVPGADKR